MTLYRPGGWVPFGLIAVVLAPIVEEAALRGYFQGRLEATYGKRTALCGGALLFALLHGSLIGMPFYFADGVVLGLVAMRTGSIWVSTAMHASANLAVLVASLRFGAGSSAADVPKQTGVPLVVFLPVLAGLAAAFIWLLSRSAMRRATAHASYDAVVPPSIP
jgi:membrane protease YdiL (CAAX protease family)